MPRYLPLILALLTSAAVVPAYTTYRLSDQLRQTQGQLVKLRQQERLDRFAGPNAGVRPGQEVLIGDSIAECLGWSDLPFVRRGTSGNTSRDVLLRFRQDALSLRPRRVTVLVGVNDLQRGYPVAEVLDRYQSLADLCRANGVPIRFGTVLPVGNSGKGTAFLNRRPTGQEDIRQLNAWLLEQPGTLDFYGLLADADGFLPAALTKDGLHPNRAAVEMMAALCKKGTHR